MTTATTTAATVTTSCYLCLRTITVPLGLFDRHVVAVCRDADRHCTRPAVPR